MVANITASSARLAWPAGFLHFLQLSQASSQADAGLACKQPLHRQLLCGCWCCRTACVPLFCQQHACQRACMPASDSGRIGVCIPAVWLNGTMCIFAANTHPLVVCSRLRSPHLQASVPFSGDAAAGLRPAGLPLLPCRHGRCLLGTLLLPGGARLVPVLLRLPGAGMPELGLVPAVLPGKVALGPWLVPVHLQLLQGRPSRVLRLPAVRCTETSTAG